MSKTFDSVHSGRHCTHSQQLQLQWHRSSIHPTPTPCLRRSFRLVSERQQPHHSLSRQVRLFKSKFSKPFASSSSSRPLAQAVAPAQEYSHALSSSSSNAFDGLCQMWDRLADEHGDRPAVLDPHHSPRTELNFRQLRDNIHQFGAGLEALGLKPGDKVSLFAENSGRWTIADQGIMLNQAADAVRGANSAVEELSFILRHSQSRGLVVDDPQLLDKLLPQLCSEGSASSNGSSNGQQQRHAVAFVVTLWGQPSGRARQALDCAVLSFDEVMARGQDLGGSFRPAPASPDTLATLVYTSGTTGQPKGVMLSHGNLDYQRRNLSHYVQPEAGNRALALLPPWHIYERSCAYFLLSCGCQQVYTNIRRFKEDLGRYPPHYFVCVPLVLDTLYKRVQAQIKTSSKLRQRIAHTAFAIGTAFIRARRVLEGTSIQYPAGTPPFAWLRAAISAAFLWPFYRLAQLLVFKKVRSALAVMKCMVSGGGSLATHLDDFFEALGLPVVNGWGLSETSPVLACRRSLPRQNVRGSVGFPIPGTSLRLVDPETLQDVPRGQQGLVLAQGPGVMTGYFRDEGATAKAFRAGHGWLDTGDLGWQAPGGGGSQGGYLVLAGRAKDTIVLSNGENVEPGPIEDACVASPYIQNLILWGQDHRMLGALVVPDPEAFEQLAAQQGGELSEQDKKAVIRKEIAAAVQQRSKWEQIAGFVLLKEPLSVEDGTITRSYKPRRDAIFAKYSTEISQLQTLLR